MKLHDFPISSNCQKVRALAYEANLPLELVPVDLSRGEARAPAFLALNPNGKVPVLEDDGIVLWESNAILTYLASKHGLLELYPVDPLRRAEVDRMLNDAPALAFYRQLSAGGPFVLRALQVVAVRDGLLRRIDHFMDATCFAPFGLPGEVAGSPTDGA